VCCHILCVFIVISAHICVNKCCGVVHFVSSSGCETWSVTLREEHRLRVFENRVLRRLFGPKRDEATGE
jgi:hypothetical protein